jgi:integrase
MEQLVNRTNYLWVNEFLLFLREVKQVSPASAERYRFYLRHLLLWAMDTPLNKVSALRPTFPVYVGALVSPQGERLAATSQKKIIEVSRQFFEWAKLNYVSEFRGLPATWIELLRPAQAQQMNVYEDHVFVTPDEVKALVATPRADGDLAHWRDCAAAARLLLSGERASAFVTSPIGAVNFRESWVHQWPELGVKTKNAKKATTFLLPIAELIEIAQSWDDFVRANLPPDRPWYAPIENHWGEQTLSLAQPGKNRNQALDRRLGVLFRRAGLPYKSAHKFRHGHAVYGLLHARTMADYKAVSMNLMHADVKITDQIYAPLLENEVQQRIAGLSNQPIAQPASDLHELFSRMSKTELTVAIQTAAEYIAR